MSEVTKSQLVDTPALDPATMSDAAKETALMTEFEAAEFLKVSPRTLQAWRVRGGGPRFCRLGRLCRYRLVDLAAFAGANVASTTTQADAQREGRVNG